jgi:GLPGLI family protein
MKKVYFFSLIFFYNLLHAQSYYLHYLTQYDGSNYQNELHVNDSLSYWTGIPDPTASDQSEEMLIKFFERNEIVFIDYVFKKKFYVKDTLHPMRWELLGSKKIILNYNCFAARTDFRGRTYVAYYTDALPATIGPWKFGGLPGAILEIASADKAYLFKATSIDINDLAKSETPSVDQKNIIDWNAYCSRFIKTTDHYARYMQSMSQSPGGAAYLKIDRPEIIYPKAQSGIGVGAE